MSLTPASVRPATVPANGSLSRAAATAGAYLALLKPRVIVLLAACGIVGAVMAGRGAASPGRLALFTLLAAMAGGGAAALNHLFERRLDARMERTRYRPLPTGRVSPAAAAAFATLLIGLSVPLAWVLLGPMVGLQFAAGAIVYAGLYTLVLKPRTHWATVIGGVAGSNMALAGWAVVQPELPLAAWFFALVVFLWTPPHFWGLAIARDADYRRAGLPMLPQVAGIRRASLVMIYYAAATAGASLLLVPAAGLGRFYLAAAVLLGTGFVLLCIRLWREPTVRTGQLVFKASGLYLALLLLAMVADLRLPL